MRLPLHGRLDDVAIYGSALDASRVLAHYQAARYVPDPPGNVQVTPGVGSAAVSWDPPNDNGSPITEYRVTPVADGVAQAVVTVPAPATSVNIPNLLGGSSYVFGVVAVNAFGASASTDSAPVGIAAPPTAPGIGQYLFIRHSAGQPTFAQHYYGFVSRDNVPGAATWTMEGYIWGLADQGVTRSQLAWGVLGGTPGQPSPGQPQAAVFIDHPGVSGDGTYIAWPGGSQRIEGGMAGINGATPVHVAVQYDGGQVCAFVNGVQILKVDGVPSCVTPTGSAALPDAPAGMYQKELIGKASFAQFRVSNTSRYPSGGFTPPTPPLANDDNTRLLYQFKEYQVSKLPSTVIPYNAPHLTVPAVYADWSNHGNHASVHSEWHLDFFGDYSDVTYTPYVLIPGISPDELDGGGSPWECSCHFPDGHYPIETLTGEFWHTFDDISIPGRGVRIDLTRTYSSARAGVLGRFGYGWNDSYDMSVSFDGGGNATVHAGNGSSVPFANTGVGLPGAVARPGHARAQRLQLPLHRQVTDAVSVRRRRQADQRDGPQRLCDVPRLHRRAPPHDHRPGRTHPDLRVQRDPGQQRE